MKFYHSHVVGWSAGCDVSPSQQQLAISIFVLGTPLLFSFCLPRPLYLTFLAGASGHVVSSRIKAAPRLLCTPSNAHLLSNEAGNTKDFPLLRLSYTGYHEPLYFSEIFNLLVNLLKWCACWKGKSPPWNPMSDPAKNICNFYRYRECSLTKCSWDYLGNPGILQGQILIFPWYSILLLERKLYPFMSIQYLWKQFFNQFCLKTTP